MNNQYKKSLSALAALIIAGQASSSLIKLWKKPDNSVRLSSKFSIVLRAVHQVNVICSSISSSSSSSAIPFPFTSLIGLYVTLNL
jgi:hypothetical protein